MGEQEQLNAIQQTDEEVRSSLRRGFTSLFTDADSFSDALGHIAGTLCLHGGEFAVRFDLVGRGRAQT